MKINILYRFRDSAWGGANQFLKALRKYFISKGCYINAPEDADVVIFASYPFNSEWLYGKVWQLKRKKRIVVINRMNGPISLYRGHDREVDDINFKFNNHIADGTIFQSEWSRQKCCDLGMLPNRYETIIGNSPDPSIFFPLENKKEKRREDKIKLIASSWSSNSNKGFDIYEFLDVNLDFSRYEMTFIGNSPISFKNIKHISPMSPEKLAIELRNHDIFISASKLETYSNSLSEALHCGLPAIARNNSSQVIAVDRGGLFFEGRADILKTIDNLAENLENHRSFISVPRITDRGEDYYNFCKKIYSKSLSGEYVVKKWSRSDFFALKKMVWQWKCKKNVRNIIKGITLNG
jgi:glycosyltransferase involved in cell wall biosynthesis